MWWTWLLRCGDLYYLPACPCGFGVLCKREMVCGGRVVIGFGHFVSSASVPVKRVWFVVDRC